MCRRSHTLCCCSICAGAGILIGCLLTTGFWGFVLGIVLIVAGLLNLQRKQE